MPSGGGFSPKGASSFVKLPPIMNPYDKILRRISGIHPTEATGQPISCSYDHQHAPKNPTNRSPLNCTVLFRLKWVFSGNTRNNQEASSDVGTVSCGTDHKVSQGPGSPSEKRSFGTYPLKNPGLPLKKRRFVRSLWRRRLYFAFERLF